ncbi:hypothetical protein CEXT_379241 [Caerostris extrusa]|uniref:Uncharacterized protein n=1 Tax=Caerostris extrusa TaxID=172846 RepID=A0AAV4TRM9_CAEEX|nr:hypothetical protein CEXT_379241 [Caerostris extrusa]
MTEDKGSNRQGLETRTHRKIAWDSYVETFFSPSVWMDQSVMKQRLIVREGLKSIQTALREIMVLAVLWGLRGGKQFPTLSSFGAHRLGVICSLVGNILSAKLIPPPSPKSGANKDADKIFTQVGLGAGLIMDVSFTTQGLFGE